MRSIVTGGYLTTFFSTLNERGIRYCVLRNYTCLPQSTGGSDVDMWVHADDLRALLNIAFETKKNCGYHLASTYGDATAVKLCFQCEDDGVQFDIFKGAIYYKNSVFIDGETIIRHTHTYNDICVMDDEFGNLIAFLKEILNNGKCSEKYLEPVKDNKIFSEDYIRENIRAFIPSFAVKLSIFLHRPLIDETIISMFSVEARKALRASPRVSKIGIIGAKIRRIFKRPGYVIAVLGTDGSGKSTIINAITPWLDECFHHGVVYNHLRPNAIPDLGVVLGKKEAPKKGETPKVNDNPHGLKPSGFVGSLIRWSYYMIDYTFGYLKKVWPKVHTKSNVFIFDRYYYDYYIDQHRLRTSLSHWVLRIGECFVPTPDLTLCLGGDPAKIYERKPETSLEEVTRQTEALRHFCAKRKRAVWIDTTLQPEESIQMAKEAIVKMLTPRFKNVKL